MSNGFLSIEEARQKLREATQAIIALEEVYERAVQAAADAEAVYRHQLGEKLRAYREQEGKAVSEAETLARADVALISRERDHAAGMLKLASEQIENARDSRRSLWRIIEWSRQRDAIVTKGGLDGS